MPTIGLLEGFTASRRMRPRPSFILDGVLDLVPVRGPVRLGFDPAVDAPQTQGQAQAVAEYTSRQVQYLMTQVNPATGQNYTRLEAIAAEQYARAQRGQTIGMREGEKARAKFLNEQAAAAAAAAAKKTVPQTLIDDNQGQYPSGPRGGSGTIPSEASFKIIPEGNEPAPMPIDTRGNPTANFSETPAGATPGGKSLLLPVLAVAAYFMMK